MLRSACALTHFAPAHVRRAKGKSHRQIGRVSLACLQGVQAVTPSELNVVAQQDGVHDEGAYLEAQAPAHPAVAEEQLQSKTDLTEAPATLSSQVEALLKGRCDHLRVWFKVADGSKEPQGI